MVSRTGIALNRQSARFVSRERNAKEKKTQIHLKSSVRDSVLVDDENSTRKCANDYKRPTPGKAAIFLSKRIHRRGIKSRDSTPSYIPGSLNVHPPREMLEIRPEDAPINYSSGGNLRVYGKARVATPAKLAYPPPLSFAVARIPCGHKAQIDY